MTMIKRAYENVVLILDENEQRVGVARGLIEDLLSVEIGAIKPGTLDRHVSLMCRLGYIALVERGYGPASLKYDLVHKKVLAVKKARGIK